MSADGKLGIALWEADRHAAALSAALAEWTAKPAITCSQGQDPLGVRAGAGSLQSEHWGATDRPYPFFKAAKMKPCEQIKTIVHVIGFAGRLEFNVSKLPTMINVLRQASLGWAATVSLTSRFAENYRWYPASLTGGVCDRVSRKGGWPGRSNGLSTCPCDDLISDEPQQP